MSDLIFDECFDKRRVLDPVKEFAQAERLDEVDGAAEVLEDSDLPAFIKTLGRATLITFDRNYCDKKYADGGYCIIHVGLREDQQSQVPGYLQRLLAIPEFQSKTTRMGKIISFTASKIQWLTVNEEYPRQTNWPT